MHEVRLYMHVQCENSLRSYMHLKCDNTFKTKPVFVMWIQCNKIIHVFNFCIEN